MPETNEKKCLRELRVFLIDNVTPSKPLIDAVKHRLTKDEMEEILECIVGQRRQMRKLLDILAKKHDIMNAFKDGLKNSGQDNSLLMIETKLAQLDVPKNA